MALGLLTRILLYTFESKCGLLPMFNLDICVKMHAN